MLRAIRNHLITASLFSVTLAGAFLFAVGLALSVQGRGTAEITAMAAMSVAACFAGACGLVEWLEV